MRETYLEVTYRKGRPMAAYLYLPRQEGETSSRLEKVAPGLLADFDAENRPIGIEILAPDQVSAATINEVLLNLGLDPLPVMELAPLKAP